LYFILVTVALDTMGAGLLIPVLPKLITSLTGEGLTQASLYGGALSAVFAVVQFVAAPVLGNISDRFGRRPVLLLSLAAFSLNYLIMGFSRSIGWLFVSQAFAGLFGATVATAGAYLADVSSQAERAHRFGLMGGAFGAGIVIGPILGGTLSAYGLRIPFFAAAALAFINVMYGIFVLPESLPPALRRPFSLARAHVLGAIRQMHKLPSVFGVLVAYFLMQLTLQALPATWPYYSMQKFGWTPQMVGYSLGMYGILSVLGQGILVSQLTRRVGSYWSATFGLVMCMTGYLGFAFATGGATALCFVVPSALGYMTGPSMNGLMSTLTPAAQQGELQGAVASLSSLALILSPPLMTRLFGVFSTGAAGLVFPGAPYVLASVLAGGSLLLLWRAKQRRRAEPLPGDVQGSH